jgi:TonB family protein
MQTRRLKSLVLASEEDGGSLDSLRFSLASDIVELVVLTADEAFLLTMREAVGGARRLWHVLSSDKVSDLLIAGEVGIVVLDVQALREPASVFIGQMKRQFPDLVVVVAGHRDDENALAGLISAGIIYRFIHKPMSPGRAKLFVEAAVRKYGERQRISRNPVPARPAGSSRPWIIAAAIAAALLAALVAFILHQNRSQESAAASGDTPKALNESPLMAKAAAALAANHLTEPSGDNALELYLRAQARNPADPAARSGLAEVHERLLARAENALLEERLDEATAAIETARKSGVESGRIAFLSAQLSKLRDQLKAAQAQAQAVQAQALAQNRAKIDAKSEPDKMTPLLGLAAQRMETGQLIEPADDSARSYIAQALRLDPDNNAVLDAKRDLATRLLREARSAIDRRDFVRATTWIEAANGIAAPANIETTQSLLAIARNQVDVDAWTQLLKNANDRLRQDRLIEPANDNAKYYLSTLRKLDPSNAGLEGATQDLGVRLVAKARRALALEQYDAARSWLDEASDIGFTSAEAAGVQRDLDAEVAKLALANAVVPATQLTTLKTVQPIYPARALAAKIEGWVELAFTVTEKGAVKDVSVKSASQPGTFDDAAIKAVSQWRYQPVLRDGRPAQIHSVVRIRFAQT